MNFVFSLSNDQTKVYIYFLIKSIFTVSFTRFYSFFFETEFSNDINQILLDEMLRLIEENFDKLLHFFDMDNSSL